MKRFAPTLIALAFAGAALAQISADDYQAWRRAERATYQSQTDAAYRAWRTSERDAYRQQSRLAYQAWRRSEQAVYRMVIAGQRGEVILIANPD